MPEALLFCPVCGGQGFAVVEAFTDDRISTTYSACNGCGLVGMTPRPNEDELREFYAGEYWEVRAGDALAKRAKQARRAKFILAFLERHLGNDTGEPLARRSRVLEIGSSFGETLIAIRDRTVALGGVVSLYGVEPSEHAVAGSPEAYRQIKVVGRSWENLRGTADGQFDLIILSHVLEHLSDPVEAARVIGRALAPGGALFVEVPNLYGHPSVEYAHNYCFSEISLQNTLVKAGLRVSALEVNGHDEPFPFYLTCLAVSSTEESEVQIEPVSDIVTRRAAATHAFRELRRLQPRPK